MSRELPEAIIAWMLNRSRHYEVSKITALMDDSQLEVFRASIEGEQKTRSRIRDDV